MSSIKLYLRQKSAPVTAHVASEIPVRPFHKATTVPVPVTNSLNITFPAGTMPLENQVAGHSFFDGKNTPGMLKQKDGRLLKPVSKTMSGEREIRFYEELKTTVDSTLMELRSFVPKYFGTRSLPINGSNINFMIMENFTDGMREPCIMDIKIGKITWDPLATPEKIESEKKKYVGTKQELGLCIPGFQVYDLVTHLVTRYDKDYGKKLTRDSFINSLKTFLNSKHGLSRHLLVQILSQLWKILHWCRSQKKLRIFSSSILITYDAYRLQKCVKLSRKSHSTGLKRSLSQKVYSAPVSLPLSVDSTNKEQLIKSNFSGQNSLAGPVLNETPKKKILDFLTHPKASMSPGNADDSEKAWHKTYDRVRLKRTHSMLNNYEREIQSIKDDYSRQLSDMALDDLKNTEQWVHVNMIDFAHVFPADQNTVDRNYLDGIENLVHFLEQFFEETY